jgi:hypothetical protein
MKFVGFIIPSGNIECYDTKTNVLVDYIGARSLRVSPVNPLGSIRRGISFQGLTTLDYRETRTIMQRRGTWRVK